MRTGEASSRQRPTNAISFAFARAERVLSLRGCKPERMLRIDEGMVLLNESLLIGDWPGHRQDSNERLREVLSDDEAREQFRAC